MAPGLMAPLGMAMKHKMSAMPPRARVQEGEEEEEEGYNVDEREEVGNYSIDRAHATMNGAF